MIICICNSIKENDLQNICRSSSYKDAESVLSKAGCKPQCGKCLDYIEEFVI